MLLVACHLHPMLVHGKGAPCHVVNTAKVGGQMGAADADQFERMDVALLLQPGPLSEQRPSSLPPLSQTAGYAAIGAGGSGGFGSFKSRVDTGGRPSTPNTPTTPGGSSAPVPRTAGAERKDWQSSFIDRRG